MGKRITLSGVITLRDNYTTTLRRIARQNNTFMRDVREANTRMLQSQRVAQERMSATPSRMSAAFQAARTRLVNFAAGATDMLGRMHNVANRVIRPVVMVRDLASGALNKIK